MYALFSAPHYKNITPRVLAPILHTYAVRGEKKQTSSLSRRGLAPTRPVYLRKRCVTNERRFSIRHPHKSYELVRWFHRVT